MPKLDPLSDLLLHLLLDALRFIRLSLRPHCALAAENLFLRKQLALYLERKVKARRASDATRLTLVLLSSLFAWRRALTIVQPDTFIRWHRKGFRLFWRWKSKPRGRPRVPAELQKLIVELANERFRRTPRRKYPPRVFGFPDSAERETPAENSQGVGGSFTTEAAHTPAW